MPNTADLTGSLRSSPSRMVLWAWLALQLVVPTALLFAPSRPRPFGWQMYSATRPTPAFTLEWPGDSTGLLDINALLPRRRGEIAYARYVPPHLCAQDSTLRSVVVTERGKAPSRVMCP